MPGAVTLANQNKSFCYDPIISGFNGNFWKTTTGTDPTIVSNKIRINAREISTYTAYQYTDVEFTLTVPAAPTAGDVRAWGFKFPALGNRGRIEFDITDTTFSAQVYGVTGGTALLNQVLTWNTAWNATATRFRIQWNPIIVTFLVNEVVFAQFGESDLNTRSGQSSLNLLPDHPMAIHINNGNADNLDVTAIIAKNIYALT